MNLLITGACGFVGSALCRAIVDSGLSWKVTGLDHLGRRGSELNRALLDRLGIPLIHGDLRCASDVEALPPADWILDCAANPSVLAGADGRTSSRQLMEHNLGGTINLLEKCRRDRAGFLLLSTSRVYSIAPLAALPVEAPGNAFRPSLKDHIQSTKNAEQRNKHPYSAYNISEAGIRESFPTTPPVSLYGSSKLASEVLALEYGATFDFPVWINRCGVLAGAGQFGRPDQGIFAYWINAHLRKKPLRYLGFGGLGHQVRDCLHPRDLLSLIQKQTAAGRPQDIPQICNVSGGLASAYSLAQLTSWCDERFGAHPIIQDGQPRPFDLPWVVLDSTLAQKIWDWQTSTPVAEILEEIANHASEHPHWLEMTGA